MRLTLRAGPGNGVPIRGTIVKSFLPFSMVPVVLITLSSDTPQSLGIPSNAILKIYDRRFATRKRRYYGTHRTWTPATENAYRKYLSSLPGSTLR